LLAALSTILETVFPAREAYEVAFIAEAEGLEHLRVHVAPGEEGRPPERRGKHVFDWLGITEEEAVTDGEADRVALELRPLVAQQMSSCLPVGRQGSELVMRLPVHLPLDRLRLRDLALRRRGQHLPAPPPLSVVLNSRRCPDVRRTGPSARRG
jgi:hypothetical protein